MGQGYGTRGSVPFQYARARAHAKMDREAATHEAGEKETELSEIEESTKEKFVALGRYPVCMSEIGAKAAELVATHIVGKLWAMTVAPFIDFNI